MTVKTSVDPSAQKNEEESPTWLRNLVKLSRFYRYCESHHSNVCNLYCIKCMGVAICPKCKDQHTQCGRKILTAYKASREATLRTEDVKSIWDISDICFYIINRKHIVFIQSKGGEGRTGNSHGDDKCQNCSYRIRSPSKYCSIECKVDFIQRRHEANTNMAVKRKSVEEEDAGAELTTANTNMAIKRKSVEEEDAGAELTTEESGKPKSYRKRPRKGIPHRAPFF